MEPIFGDYKLMDTFMDLPQILILSNNILCKIEMFWQNQPWLLSVKWKSPIKENKIKYTIFIRKLHKVGSGSKFLNKSQFQPLKTYCSLPDPWLKSFLNC